MATKPKISAKKKMRKEPKPANPLMSKKPLMSLRMPEEYVSFKPNPAGDIPARLVTVASGFWIAADWLPEAVGF
jgi:hypothetical protein